MFFVGPFAYEYSYKVTETKTRHFFLSVIYPILLMQYRKLCPFVFRCVVCIDSVSIKVIYSHTLPNILWRFVFISIAKKGNGERGTGNGCVEKSSFFASYRLCSCLLIRPSENCVFPSSSPIRIRSIRSHPHHAAPRKYKPLLKVVLLRVAYSNTAVLNHFLHSSSPASACPSAALFCACPSA